LFSRLRYGTDFPSFSSPSHQSSRANINIVMLEYHIAEAWTVWSTSLCRGPEKTL